MYVATVAMLYNFVFICIGLYVSAYDPAETCPDVAVTTTTTPLTTHSVSVDSTEAPNQAHRSNSKDVAIKVGVPLTVLAILVTVVVISCVAYRR